MTGVFLRANRQCCGSAVAVLWQGMDRSEGQKPRYAMDHRAPRQCRLAVFWQRWQCCPPHILLYAVQSSIKLAHFLSVSLSHFLSRIVASEEVPDWDCVCDLVNVKFARPFSPGRPPHQPIETK